MLRIGADENFNGAIVRGMLRRQPVLDLVRIQDIGLSAITDPELLEWAAREQRVVLTHDVTTLRQFAYARGFRCQASSKWVTKSPSEKPLRTSC